MATVAALALSSPPADADLPVIDVTAIGHILETLGIEKAQLAELITTYNEIVQVYGTAVHIWNDLEEIVGADQWAPGLSDPAARNPLPFAAVDHPGWVGGFNDPNGLTFGSQYLQQNTVGGDWSIYNDGTFVGGEILKGLRALSAMQAVSTTHIQSIETRIFALNDLFGRLATIGTLQETASLSARLHSELNYAHSQQVQAQQVQSAAQMQLAVLQHNQRQWAYQDESNGISVNCQALAASVVPLSLSECTAAHPAGVQAAN